MKDHVVISDAYIGFDACEECLLGKANCPILKHEWIGMQSNGRRYWINNTEIPPECGSRFIKFEYQSSASLPSSDETGDTNE